MQNCVACHSRLPSDREFPLAKRFTDRAPLDSLTPSEKARLLVVVRRFQDAMLAWETLFRAPATSLASLDYGGDLLDYLTIALRVVRDDDRARSTLVGLQKREGVPDYMNRNIESWLKTLAEYEEFDPSSPKLERARRLVGEPSTSVPEEGQGRMVSDLLASGLLLQLLDESEAWNAELAEAFYLLGVTEARSVDAFWVPYADFHLEMAIRVDPHGPFAVPAFELLKSQLELGYGGSSGVHLPTDVAVTLKELKKLMKKDAK
jgi:hypothetical protein